MISLKAISGAATNKKTYERGLEYYNQRRVERLREEPDRSGDGTRILADVQGKYSYECEASLGADGQIRDHFCDCPAFYSYEGCCKHIVAMLLQYYYRKVTEAAPLPKIREATATSNAAKQLIRRYSDRLVNSAVSGALPEKVRLTPFFGLDPYGGVTLELSVGTARMYVVRDLPKFYNDILCGNVAEYGTGLRFLHNENAFEEDARPLLRFFLGKYREFSAYAGRQFAASGDKRRLPLSPHSFDELFSLFEGRDVFYKDGSEKKPVRFEDAQPDLTLDVEKKGDAFVLSMPLPELVIAGEARQYCLIDGRLLRCGEAYTQAVGPLLRALMENGGKLTVAEADMGACTVGVIETVQPFVHIRAEEGLLQPFAPQPLASRLYLDMPVPGMITGSLRFCYGSEEIDAMSDRKVAFQRDIRGELAAQGFVKKYFEAYDPEKHYLYIEDDDRIFQLLSEGLDEMAGSLEIYTTDHFKSVSVRRPPQVSIGVRLRSNLIDFRLDTGDFPPEELAALLDSYRQHKRYHKLRDGSFVGLENSPLADVSQLAQGLGLTDAELSRGGAEVPKYRALYLDAMLKDSATLKMDRDPAFKAMVRDIGDVGDSEIEPPQSLRKILRKYQQTGFRWLKTMSRYGFGGVLADDMGLGKTLEAIAFLLSCKEEDPNASPSLVVCPASLVLNWESEIARFAPQLRAVSVIGEATVRRDLIARAEEFDIVITSYDLLKRDIDLYEPHSFLCLIIDEAQYIKNSGTQNARAVKAVHSAQRFALTGTPIENSLAELWSIFDFLMPGYLYSHARFKESFELPVMRDDDKEALENLKRMLAPFILRRLKSSVLRELPPKTETVLFAGLAGEQKRLYDASLAQIRAQLGASLKEGAGGGSRVVILAMLTRLRQICCDPSLCFEDYSGESAKLELCLELLESSVDAGHKVLLFSQFTSMLSILEAKLRARGIRYFVLKGSTPKEERADLTTRFNKDDTQVFLISLKAGGTGLNLTGADIVIHYDPWWNISAQNQATDRAHRIGQKNSVQVYKLIAKNTIEEKILALQQEKLKLADSIIAEGEGLLTGMSAQELLKLFD